MGGAIESVGADLRVGPWRGPRRGVSGRTHRSAPTRLPEAFRNQWELVQDGTLSEGRNRARSPSGESEQGGLRRGVVTPPYGCVTGSTQQRADVGIGPYGETGRLPRPPGAAAHSGASAPRSRGTGGNRSRDYPQRGHQRRAIPQSRLRRASSLYAREPCPAGDGRCGLPRRPCGPPRNDNGFLSFRGAERRGNPSFLLDGRGSGRRGRRPLRKVYRSSSSGPM